MKKTKKLKNPDNLYRRNGIWWIRYNVNGEKIRASLQTRNLKEAKRTRDRILAKRSVEARFGLPVPKEAVPVRTFKQIASMWLDSRLADDSLALNTRKLNALVVEKHLIPHFGRQLMNEITVEDLECFIGILRSKCARSTVSCYFDCLISIFRQAIRRGWYEGINPIERLDRIPSRGPGRDTTLTESEAASLLDQLTGCLYFKSALALHTGLRWGEVHGLGWADITLQEAVPILTVQRSYRGRPKNEASRSPIPISHEAAALLRRWQAQQNTGCPWVFPSQRGTILYRSSWSEANAIKKAAKAAGIDKHITPHVFRHTFGTWVYERTSDPKTVQRLMRHADFKTSMRYVHDRRNLAPIVNLLPNLTRNRELRLI